jgi:hypothetical protein
VARTTGTELDSADVGKMPLDMPEEKLEKPLSKALSLA